MVQPFSLRVPPARLSLEVEWVDASPEGDGEMATLGVGQLKLGDHAVWGSDNQEGGIRWSWIDFVEFLAENWMYLIFEEDYPLFLNPQSPIRLWASAQQDWKERMRWETLTEEGRDKEEDELYSFGLRHDLGHALKGFVQPSIWVVPTHGMIWLSAQGENALSPRAHVIKDLEAIGDQIIQRLRNTTDARAEYVVHEWNNRWPKTTLHLIQATTGFAEDYLRQLGDDEQEHLVIWETDENRFDVTEVQAAARMVTSGYPPILMKDILRTVRRLEKRTTPKLDDITHLAENFLASTCRDKMDFAQGYELALWLRDQPGVIGSFGEVNPEDLLRNWGVEVREFDTGSPSIEALACWGPRHGPAVLVNPKGRRWVRSSLARRSILAHEICHLLIDRHGALPLAEVLGGNVAAELEGRANAFAAELLLPRELVEKRIGDGDVESVMSSLSTDFGASFEVVAWQIHNSGAIQRLSEEDTERVKQYVSQPESF